MNMISKEAKGACAKHAHHALGHLVFNQARFVAAFVNDITHGLSVGDKLQEKLADAIASAGPEGRKPLQKALYAACREKSDRHYGAMRKLWQMAIGGSTGKKAATKPQNEALVKFLRASASVLAKGTADYPAEVFAMLVDCQLAFEDATAE